MLLPKQLDAEFWQELKEFEQERNMTYVTTGERIGYERGIEEGEQRLILKLLQRRFGELPSEAIASIQSLDVIQLEELAEALLDFTEIDDLVRWFTV
jgi:predicted transposase YdaD